MNRLIDPISRQIGSAALLLVITFPAAERIIAKLKRGWL